MKKLPILIFFIFIFFFVFIKPASAAVLFQDDFEDGDYDGWTIHQGTWSVQEVMGSKRFGTEIIPTFTVVESTAGDTSWTDYIYELDMIALQGADKNIIFRVIDSNNKYEVHMKSKYNLICIGRWVNGIYWDSCKGWPFSNGVIYHLKTVLQGTTIKFYVDDQLAIDFDDTVSPITHGKIGLRVGTGADPNSEVYYDNILVTSLEPSPTPTPTPTPIPFLQPVIFLPGLGASWNHEAMILGASKPPEDWYMTPGVKSYDGIIQTFQNAGYVLGINFFVFNYDWRKPVDEIANDLKEFLSRHPLPAGTKIDLVGHSLGGMVGRTYVQKNPENQVDQLLTLGSPHKGAVKTYYLWEGAELSKGLSGWQRIGAGILIQLKKHGFENNVETVRQIVPGLKDILPTFAFLKQDGVIKPLEQMNQKNLWLAAINTLPLPEHLISRLTTILGKNVDTLRWINVKGRNSFDKILGKWEDGRPIEEEFASGDNSVLLESGQLNEASVVEIDGADHGDLVESIESQQKVMDVLELSPSSIASAPEITYEPSLVFQLASSVNMTIYGPGDWQIGEGIPNTTPDGIYSSVDKLIIIPNPIPGNYRVEVNQEGSGGHYRLLIGRILSGGDIWTEEEGETSPSQPQTHIILYNPEPLQSKLQLAILAREKLNEAKAKAQNLKRPLKILLVKAIETRIKEIERIITLLNKEKPKQAQIKTKEAIFSISILEKNFKFWAKLFKLTPEDQEEFRLLFRQAKDYLLQAYEF